MTSPGTTMDTKRFFQQEMDADAHLLAEPRAWSQELRRRKEAGGFMPYYREVERNEGSKCLFGGRSLVMLGSNNYLGLTTDPRVREASMRAIAEKGPSLTGSRLLNGTTADHVRLERKIASFLGREDALVFTTGYQANVGVLSALLSRPGARLIIDRSCHASILDGAKVAGCEILPFRHNDARHLDQILRRSPSAASNTLVMVDGMYSMEGDLADLPAIADVCSAHGVAFVVDEAHSLGTVGATGRGVEEHFGMPGCADLLTGTFSKTLASIGGFVAGSADLIEYVRYQGRSAIFSASLPPGQLAAAEWALDILIAEPQRVGMVLDNARYWRKGLHGMGLWVDLEGGPIVPIPVGEVETCLRFAECLLEEGVYVNCALFPAVRIDESMIRTSVMATHSLEELDTALDAVFKAVQRTGLGKGGLR